VQQFVEPFSEPTPAIRVRHFPNSGPFGQRIGSSRVIDLGEAEQRFQPRPLPCFQWSANQSRHEIRLRAMENGSLDLDDRANRHRTQALQIEDTTQDEVGLRADVLLGRSVTGLHRKAQH
jgi:hypothetical protein